MSLRPPTARTPASGLSTYRSIHGSVSAGRARRRGGDPFVLDTVGDGRRSCDHDPRGDRRRSCIAPRCRKLSSPNRWRNAVPASTGSSSGRPPRGSPARSWNQSSSLTGWMSTSAGVADGGPFHVDVGPCVCCHVRGVRAETEEGHHLRGVPRRSTPGPRLPRSAALKRWMCTHRALRSVRSGSPTHLGEPRGARSLSSEVDVIRGRPAGGDETSHDW